MSQDPTVNAGDIARLVDVGRAAVSNWRRRHEDFPQPVGGTTSSPLFSLREIENWLRRNGKSFDVSVADRVWQRLRAGGDDLSLGRRVGHAGVFLTRLRAGDDVDQEGDDPELIRMLADLAAERGPACAFELLCDRYQRAHSRHLTVTPADVASLMVRLAVPAGGTVLDPACGMGTLVLDTPADRVLGQEVNDTIAAIAASRMLLGGLRSEVRVGDSLRQDGFPDELADAVLCDPPFNERGWGHEDLASDPRWEYGLPPRGESELAWVQHCLAHTRPGGLVAILMPAAASGRRPGRRIRGNLLRAGALRAVFTLSTGGPDLWLLCRPEAGQRSPTHILMMEAADHLPVVEVAWQSYLREPESGLPAGAGAVPVVDLLDDDVDVSPGRYRLRHGGQHLGRGFAAALDRLRANTLIPPDLTVLSERHPLPSTTVGELAKAGLITVRHATATAPTSHGDLPVLLAKDLADGGPPSGRTSAAPGLVTARLGDVAASATGLARVITTEAVLGPHLALYRVDPERIDPHFLAGVLRSAEPRTLASVSRIDLRRARFPRLSLDQQRSYGQAFQQLLNLWDTTREMAELGETLARLGLDGLLDGCLRP